MGGAESNCMYDSADVLQPPCADASLKQTNLADVYSDALGAVRSQQADQPLAAVTEERDNKGRKGRGPAMVYLEQTNHAHEC